MAIEVTAEPAREHRPGWGLVIVSLTAAAIICSALLALIFTFLKLAQEGEGSQSLLTGLILYGSVALLFALPVALLLGGPLYWLLSRRRTPSRSVLALVAGILAAVPFLLFASVGMTPGEGLAGLIPLTALLFSVGAAGGLIFALVAGLGRGADRDVE